MAAKNGRMENLCPIENQNPFITLKNPNHMNRKMRRQLEKKAKIKITQTRQQDNHEFITMHNVLKEFGFEIEGQYMSGMNLDGVLRTKLSNRLYWDKGVNEINLTPTSKGIEISILRTQKEYQGLGYGSSMLDFILLKMWGNDISHVSLYPMKTSARDTWSLASDLTALENFYRKRGFEWDNTKKEMVIDWEAFGDYMDSRNLQDNLDLGKVFYSGYSDLRMAA
jgi:GNAT superfamily N-acetyltransferase